MAYTDDFNVSGALRSLYDRARTVSKNVFTGERPQATPEQMNEFLVVSIPSRLESSTYGGGYGATQAYCNIEAYVKLRKGGVEDITKVSKMLDQLLSMFPIDDGLITASRPKILLRGNDGLGFSSVLVRAELVIK